MLLDERRKIAAIDTLHDEEVDAIRTVSIVGGNNVRMAQFGSGLDLPLFKAGDGSLVLCQRGRQEFDCHEPIHAAVPRLEDLPHPACTDFLQQQVVPQRQRLSLAAGDFFHLKFRQLLLANEVPGQVLGVFGRGLRRHKVLERVCRENPAVFNLLEELFEGDSHPNRSQDAGTRDGLRCGEYDFPSAQVKRSF